MEEYRKKCSARVREYCAEKRRREAQKKEALDRAVELAHLMRIRYESEEPIEVKPALVDEIAVLDAMDHDEEPSEIYSNDFHAIDESTVPDLPIVRFYDLSCDVLHAPAQNHSKSNKNDSYQR